jgi:hypothetical protein
MATSASLLLLPQEITEVCVSFDVYNNEVFGQSCGICFDLFFGPFVCSMIYMPKFAAYLIWVI